jgi:hypothetical protein
MENVYQEFPKWKYHPKLGSKVVQNAAEEKALGRGWYNTPNDFPKPSKPTVTLRTKIKPWWAEWEWAIKAIAVVLGLIAAIVALFKVLR